MEERGGWRWWNPDDPSSVGNYDSEVAKVVIDQMVAEVGVIVYYFAQVTQVFKDEDGNRITGVRAEAYLKEDHNCERALRSAKDRGEVTVPREDALLAPMRSLVSGSLTQREYWAMMALNYGM